MSGICVDALNAAGCPPADTLFEAGADGVRLVAFDSPEFFAYAGDLLAAGLTVAVVLARESFGDDDYAGWASFYAERIAPTYWIIGNEMDAYLLPEPSPSSWKMTPQEYADFWFLAGTMIRERQPDAKLVIGGLVAGQPSYLDEVLPLLDPPPWGVDVHPYGKSAGEAGELFDLYRTTVAPAELRALLASYGEVLEAWGGERRLLVLEWWRPAEEIAEYEAMLRAETGWATWFCWSDGMVPGFGLVNEDGILKEEGLAFQEANMSEDAPAPKSLEEAEGRPDWQLGERWNAQAIIEWGDLRIGTYWYGLGFQRGEDVWQVPDVSVTSHFFPGAPA
jgi:hypothetical protein